MIMKTLRFLKFLILNRDNGYYESLWRRDVTVNFYRNYLAETLFNNLVRSRLTCYNLVLNFQEYKF